MKKAGSWPGEEKLKYMKKVSKSIFVFRTALIVLVGLQIYISGFVEAQENAVPARGMFLVASRQIKDPLFMESVVLLLNTDESGAMGLIINKPSERSLSSIFPDMKKADRRKDRLYFGGPVGTNQLLILLRTKEKTKETTLILDGIAVSADQAVLMDALKKKKAGSDFRLYAGYSGWVTGQLEWEIKRGDWFLIAADAATVFNEDETKVWPLLIRKSQEIMVQTPFRIRDHAIVNGSYASLYASGSR